ncbi:WD40-repeat-containing domain protein [Phlyctochytrium arcticum]|nr:WD40-repeat-containing domain protein [Phlyctochytrium arcticum]
MTEVELKGKEFISGENERDQVMASGTPLNVKETTANGHQDVMTHQTPAPIRPPPDMDPLLDIETMSDDAALTPSEKPLLPSTDTPAAAPAKKPRKKAAPSATPRKRKTKAEIAAAVPEDGEKENTGVDSPATIVAHKKRKAKAPAAPAENAEDGEPGSAVATSAPRKRKPKVVKSKEEDGDGEGEGSSTTTPAAKRKRKKAASQQARITEFTEEQEFGAQQASSSSVSASFKKLNAFKQFPTDPPLLANLSNIYPDPFWTKTPSTTHMVSTINVDNPLTLVPKSSNFRDPGHITAMSLSPDGSLLATFSTLGVVRIWDLETYEPVQMLQDTSETEIDEFYCGQFTPTGSHLVVAGKLKDSKKWSQEDEDNHILPCPIKTFDILSGEVVARWDGHEEEVLSCKGIEFGGDWYWVTTSQDGWVWKWKVAEDGWTLLDKQRMLDGDTCMAFNVSFLPHTGNKYFVASCDSGICLFDFDNGVKLQAFQGLYSCYCDCVKFVDAVDFPPSPSWDIVLEDESGEQHVFAYLLSRGVEEVEVVDGDVPINTEPNSVRLHKLSYPNTPGGPFTLTEVQRYTHEFYRSNSWLTKISSNGRYVLAPTYDGAVVIFEMASGGVVGVLRDHEGVEVRDCIWGWRGGEVITCGDDGNVKVYTQSTKPLPVTDGASVLEALTEDVPRAVSNEPPTQIPQEPIPDLVPDEKAPLLL